MTELDELRAWLQVEYDKAKTAAREAKHRGSGRAMFHASAVARMCALGEVLKRLDNPPKTS